MGRIYPVSTRLALPFTTPTTGSSGSDGFVAATFLWVCKDLSRVNDLQAYDRRRFRIDTGCTHTSISTSLARQLDLTVPPTLSRTRLQTVHGRQIANVRVGLLLAKFVGLEAFPFIVRCVFHDDWPADVPALLGMNALRPRHGGPFRWIFEGNSSADAPDGRLIIEGNSSHS